MQWATVDWVQPKGWALSEPATGDPGAEAWIDFETAEARGFGHLRLKDGQAFTLLTTMVELKGLEEPLGHRREKGVEHVITKGRRS